MNLVKYIFIDLLRKTEAGSSKKDKLVSKGMVTQTGKKTEERKDRS